MLYNTGDCDVERMNMRNGPLKRRKLQFDIFLLLLFLIFDKYIILIQFNSSMKQQLMTDYMKEFDVKSQNSNQAIIGSHSSQFVCVENEF